MLKLAFSFASLMSLHPATFAVMATAKEMGYFCGTNGDKNTICKMIHQ